MLSIRNIDLKYPIAVLEVEYYDSNGELVDRLVKEQFDLGPLASRYFYTNITKKSGQVQISS